MASKSVSFFSHWWRRDGNVIDECVCVIFACSSAVHGISDTIAFRLELNLLTVSFIQDAGTYCSGVTFDPIHSIWSALWHMWSRRDILWRHALLRDLISPIVLLTVLSPFVDKESRHTLSPWDELMLEYAHRDKKTGTLSLWHSNTHMVRRRLGVWQQWACPSVGGLLWQL